MRTLLVSAAMGCVLGATSSAWGANNMLFILDGSNSMWGQVDGVAKIEIAKDVLVKLMTDIPVDAQVGLVAYGHRTEGDCSDIQTLSAIGSEAPSDVAAKITALTPRGKTPISAALEQSAAEFAGFGDDTNSIILISDGIESCEGDPCAVAEAIASRGIGVRVHVVGFDVDATAREQLACIAEKGGGRYVDADDTAGLQDALAEVRDVIVADNAPPAEPELPAPVELFADDFDGDELAGHWRIENENLDAYVVENGSLLVVSSSAGVMADGTIQNLFRLDMPPPDGDWTMTARLLPSFQTGEEDVAFGLYDGPENYLVARLRVVPDKYYGHKFLVLGSKRTGTQETGFEHVIFRYECNVCGDDQSISTFAAEISRPILLSLIKRGRSYSASAQWEGTDESGSPYPVVQTEELTTLRGAGNPALGLTQAGGSGGESLVEVDWVKISAP